MKAVVYIDGAFSAKSGRAVWAYAITYQGFTYEASGDDVPTGFLLQRNIAGEVVAAVKAIRKLFRLGCRDAEIFHDYKGIGCWPDGKWKAKNPYTQTYAKYVTDCRAKGLNLVFTHVKGHTGVDGNERVDALCKDALTGLFDTDTKGCL